MSSGLDVSEIEPDLGKERESKIFIPVTGGSPVSTQGEVLNVWGISAQYVSGEVNSERQRLLQGRV
jgi:hypothetical protein